MPLVYSFRPLDEQDAQTISHWHYDGPYAFYDADQDPEDLAELLDPASWGRIYWSVLDEQQQLVGLFGFEEAGDTVELGFGLRPDLTGQGLGLSFLEAGIDFARERFAPRLLRLSVATFNVRAIRVYEKAGFRPVRLYMRRTNGGLYEYLDMELEAQVPSAE